MSVINGLYNGASGGDSLSYDNSNSGLASTDMQGAIDEVAALNRMVMVPYTLLELNWEGTSAPYRYRITSDKIKANDCNIYIALGADVTLEQYEMSRDALIEPVTQNDGYIDIIARGNRPTMNIPIQVYIGKIISVPEGRDARYILYTNKSENSWIQSDNVAGALIEMEEKLRTFAPEGRADAITVDDTKLGLNVKNVQEALEKITAGGIGGGSRSHIPITIKKTGWIGTEAPYMNTITMEKITSNSDITISSVFEMTMEQYQELSRASIVAGCTLDGKLVLKAYGEKPSIDLDVEVIIYN